MIKKTLTAGMVAAVLTLAAAPAVAIGDSDGSAASVQGNGGTNNTGTVGNNSPNFHVLDNPNICLPEIHNIGVGALIGVAVPVEVSALNNTPKQICNQGQATQSSGDGGISHLIG
ncbi:rodlet layer protein [Kitasatospora sp. NPDC052896]|uniref:rodlet layer protein n=1 Tax=Kitasatospora sp. NPDC052896 TaxID=3364061 RepID=UPI0037CAAD9F